VSRIYWDSMLFIYWLEDHPQHAVRMNRILERMRERGDRLCTSVFTVGEVLTGLYKRNEAEMAAQVHDALRAPGIELIPFTADTADSYARIRATHRVSPPDAIHLASASHAGVDLFLTNDHRLKALTVPGIHFIAGMDVDLF